MGELSKVRPTIAFHASMTQAFGKGVLISLLRQFGQLHQDKKQISCGVIGYPNVGKSSIINTLIGKKSCKVAPIPGETKIWQYVNLFKRIALIDCPGVVVNTSGDTEIDSVLKGVVRAERLHSPEDYADAIVARVQREHRNAQYQLSKKAEYKDWKSSSELLEAIARQSGRLRKGGDPCVRSAAVMLINDFQRGRLPHYVAPPQLKVGDSSNAAVDADASTDELASDAVPGAISTVPKHRQDLDHVGAKHMKHDEGARGDK
jgi:nuclear GTP-binding protein